VTLISTSPSEKTKLVTPAKRPGRKKRVKAKRPGWSGLGALVRSPEHQAKVRADRKANPEKYKRTGVPDGMTRKQALPLWAKARSQANEWIKMLEDEGSLERDDVLVPDSDAEKAKACLKEACVMALGPIDNRTKLMALNTVLTYTKEKPVTKTESKISSEDWLRAALDANKPG
jgi:hypothetical protein